MLILFMHMFRGGSTTNPFDIQSFFYILRSACMLSSTTKRWRLKVQSCPYSYFDVDDNIHIGD